MHSLITQQEVIDIYNKLKKKLQNINNLMDWNSIQEKININSKILEENIWEENFITLRKNTENLKKKITIKNYLEENINGLEELINISTTLDELKLLHSELCHLEKNAINFFKQLKYTEEDEKNCYIEIHSGAGGTDAQDWAYMIQKMYIGWCNKNNIKYEIIDIVHGKEIGIKNVLIKISNGEYLYGKLKNEIGIHRLVRLSPFNANDKRHTSFASVNVFPEIEDNINIVINNDDLIIDTYRSSGAGGQHVNTTDSAVRIIHKPTGIIVQCQNERSQHSNKEMALKILKNRLLYKKLQEIEEEKQLKNKNKQNISFGSQKRSYTLHPYKMVKDHVTKYESSQVENILLGEIDELLEV